MAVSKILSPSSGPCSIRYWVVSAPPSSALVTAIQPNKITVHITHIFYLMVNIPEWHNIRLQLDKTERGVRSGNTIHDVRANGGLYDLVNGRPQIWRGRCSWVRHHHGSFRHGTGVDQHLGWLRHQHWLSHSGDAWHTGGLGHWGGIWQVDGRNSDVCTGTGFWDEHLKQRGTVTWFHNFKKKFSSKGMTPIEAEKHRSNKVALPNTTVPAVSVSSFFYKYAFSIFFFF